MGRQRSGAHASGAGSPIFFRCPVARRMRASKSHEVIRTGRTKPHRTGQYTALGTRSLSERHEYDCRTCGHHGWTNHIDILKKPIGYAARRHAHPDDVPCAEAGEKGHPPHAT